MGMVAMIWTALYISFNEIGATSIQGVQGRYYHPLLILLYIVLGGRYITVNIEKRKFDYLFLVMCCNYNLHYCRKSICYILCIGYV